MKSLILKQNENFPELIVYQKSSNFGDQVIEFIQENVDGSKQFYYHMEYEGQWVSFDTKTMNELFDILLERAS